MSSALEEVWRQREEEIYPQLFGSSAECIFVLSSNLFTETFQQSSIDPRWLHYGVQEFPPAAQRNSWLYVSSGASNPWELEPEAFSQDEYSGFGSELVLETATRSQWAILMVQRMLAFNILLSHGRYGASPPLDVGHRIPLRGPITGESHLQNLVVGTASHYAHSFALPSGKVDLLHLVGATDREIAYAKQNGSDKLLIKLAAAGYFPITDPARSSLDDV